MRHDWTAHVLAFFALFLTARFSMMAQVSRNGANVEAQQFEANCAVCHASDGNGGKGPALTTANVVGMSDAALIKAVHDGTAAGMPPFAQLGDENIAAMVHYLRTLQGQSDTSATGAVAGDATAGRALYFGRAQCSSCHTIQGNGGFIASDLTAYGRSHAADAIRKAIITPDDPLAPDARVIEVRTKNGKKLAGVMRNEDSFNIVLQTEDGRYHFFARGDLADVQYTDHSLMPHTYGTRLTASELTDIIRFLIVTGQSTPAEPAPSHRRGNDD
jgi:putative heme-binding domain-containing protein